jgi:hypothetical protein
MPAKGNYCVADEADAIEQAILDLLMREERVPLWAVDELVREIGDRLATVDALRRLDAAGVIHCLHGEFVLVSRSTRRVIELWG